MPGTAYTAEQIADLKKYWAQGMRPELIGKKIGRSTESVRTKAVGLGLPPSDRKKFTSSIPTRR